MVQLAQQSGLISGPVSTALMSGGTIQQNQQKTGGIITAQQSAMMIPSSKKITAVPAASINLQASSNQQQSKNVVGVAGTQIQGVQAQPLLILQTPSLHTTSSQIKQRSATQQHPLTITRTLPIQPQGLVATGVQQPQVLTASNPVLQSMIQLAMPVTSTAAVTASATPRFQNHGSSNSRQPLTVKVELGKANASRATQHGAVLMTSPPQQIRPIIVSAMPQRPGLMISPRQTLQHSQVASRPVLVAAPASRQQHQTLHVSSPLPLSGAVTTAKISHFLKEQLLQVAAQVTQATSPPIPALTLPPPPHKYPATHRTPPIPALTPPPPAILPSTGTSMVLQDAFLGPNSASGVTTLLPSSGTPMQGMDQGSSGSGTSSVDRLTPQSVNIDNLSIANLATSIKTEETDVLMAAESSNTVFEKEVKREDIHSDMIKTETPPPMAFGYSSGENNTIYDPLNIAIDHAYQSTDSSSLFSPASSSTESTRDKFTPPRRQRNSVSTSTTGSDSVVRPSRRVRFVLITVLIQSLFCMQNM